MGRKSSHCKTLMLWWTRQGRENSRLVPGAGAQGRGRVTGEDPELGPTVVCRGFVRMPVFVDLLLRVSSKFFHKLYLLLSRNI